MASLTSTQAHRSARPSPLALLRDPGALLTRGIGGGLFGGFAFILANMLYANHHGKPAVAPLLSISTIFNHTSMPMPKPVSPADVIAGLVLHIALSMTFGIVFARVVAPVARHWAALLAGGLVYGIVLWAVNIELFGRTVFPWFTNPNGPNQIFELWIHPVGYGLFLAPFFFGLARRLPER